MQANSLQRLFDLLSDMRVQRDQGTVKELDHGLIDQSLADCLQEIRPRTGNGHNGYLFLTDSLQEYWLKVREVREKLTKFDGDTPAELKVFILRSIRNLGIDINRRHNRRRVVPLETNLPIPQSGPTVSSIVSRKEESELRRVVRETLPEADRILFWLKSRGNTSGRLSDERLAWFLGGETTPQDIARRRSNPNCNSEADSLLRRLKNFAKGEVKWTYVNLARLVGKQDGKPDEMNSCTSCTSPAAEQTSGLDFPDFTERADSSDVQCSEDIAPDNIRYRFRKMKHALQEASSRHST